MHTPAVRPHVAPDEAFILQPATLAEPLSFLSADTERTTADEDSAADPFSTNLPAQTIQEFLDQVLASTLLSRDDLEGFLQNQRDLKEDDLSRLTTALVAQGLLTDYQVNRLRAGRTFGLVLGNYRILDRLGAGGMGVVYKAEHIYLKRTVAVKVVVLEAGRDSIAGQRFHGEMQAMAALQHPNIVTVFDAGELPLPSLRRGVLCYLAMECVHGQTLDVHVQEHGPFPVAQACRLICQAAQGLQHAHERGLVHRDIKPSNLLLTPQEQLKILDFGLAQLCRQRHTEAFALLGTIDYVAPEQARDARSADIRADVYGLGGTLYWLLTGRKPFPGNRPVIEELLARQREKPLPLRQVRPDLPPELEIVLARMLAHAPDDRYATPLAVLSALTPFQESPAPVTVYSHEPRESVRARRVLLVSARSEWSASLADVFARDGIACVTIGSAELAQARLRQTASDVVLIDLHLSEHAGLNLCHQLRATPAPAHLKVLLLSTEDHTGQQAAGRKLGADEVVPAALSFVELSARTHALLRLKEVEEYAADLASAMGRTSQQLDQAQQRRETDLSQAQEVLLFALTRITELRGLETAAHLARMQGYVRVLTEEALRLPVFAGRMDEPFVRMLERCVPVHDLGKIALPDHVLLKPGKLDDEERAIMESHAAGGADLLTAAARQHGAPLALLNLAADIARYHHERFDGTGYPDGLAGEAIPLAARFVTVADVYDALRSKLVYKPGLSHAAACRLILEKSPGQFDPDVLLAFRHSEASFAQIFARQ